MTNKNLHNTPNNLREWGFYRNLKCLSSQLSGYAN